MPSSKDYDAESEDAETLLAMNKLAAGIVFSAAGMPFLLAGEEFARTKYGCDDSFSSPAQLNKLDWRRTQRFESLVGHYAYLIRLRREHPAYFGGPRITVPRKDEVVVFRIGDDCIAINPCNDERTQPTVALEVSTPYHEVSRIAPDVWTCEYCSADVPAPTVSNRLLTLPPMSFTVWRRQRK